MNPSTGSFSASVFTALLNLIGAVALLSGHDLTAEQKQAIGVVIGSFGTLGYAAYFIFHARHVADTKQLAATLDLHGITVPPPANKETKS